MLETSYLVNPNSIIEFRVEWTLLSPRPSIAIEGMVLGLQMSNFNSEEDIVEAAELGKAMIKIHTQN